MIQPGDFLMSLKTDGFCPVSLLGSDRGRLVPHSIGSDAARVGSRQRCASWRCHEDVVKHQLLKMPRFTQVKGKVMDPVDPSNKSRLPGTSLINFCWTHFPSSTKPNPGSWAQLKRGATADFQGQLTEFCS